MQRASSHVPPLGTFSAAIRSTPTAPLTTSTMPCTPISIGPPTPLSDVAGEPRDSNQEVLSRAAQRGRQAPAIRSILNHLEPSILEGFWIFGLRPTVPPLPPSFSSQRQGRG